MMYYCTGYTEDKKHIDCLEGFSSWSEIPDEQCDTCFEKQRAQKGPLEKCVHGKFSTDGCSACMLLN